MSPASPAARSTAIPPPTSDWNARARPGRAREQPIEGQRDLAVELRGHDAGQRNDGRVQEPAVALPLARAVRLIHVALNIPRRRRPEPHPAHGDRQHGLAAALDLT